jgi:hypothetical protein
MIPRHAARLICAVGLALSAMNPGMARAQDDATVEMARQRFREGVQFYDQRQYDKARLAFLQAFALKPHPSVLLNLAQSELRAGHPEDACGHFSEYIRTNTEANEAEKQEAELGLAASKSKVAEVTVTVDVSGAQITVDGVDKGAAPLPGPLYLAPGAHTIDAKAGDRHASKSVTVGAGQAASAALSIRTAGAAGAAAAPPTSGAPAPAAPEPAEDDAAPAAEEPEADATSGSAEASTAGRKPFFGWLTSTPLAMVGGGVAVLGLGGAGVFAALSSKDYSTADNTKRDIVSAWEVDKGKFQNAAPCSLPAQASSILGAGRIQQYATACKKYQDSADAGDSKKTLAIVSGVVGGAALLGTVVYYFVDPHAKKSSASNGAFHAELVPWGDGGLGVVGTF